jgi:hypothetical protein
VIQSQRNALSLSLLRRADRIAALEWNAHLGRKHLGRKHMGRKVVGW